MNSTKFTLVVPALNEQDAIAQTLRRALAARRRVEGLTAIEEMTVVFVNDGSTDRTQEIVDEPEFDEVVKLHFEKNEGYGAAIKAGWGATDAEYLGFIDADGTCDPEVCVELLNRMESTGADVVLAARLTPESKMPLIRRIGNVLFARLLGLVSGRELTDCASGFRVVRRSSLPYMSPLPNGLHFTPAMSAICLLDPRLTIAEVPMAYQERIGRSKLSVIEDGFRFLHTILFSACCYAPIKTMLGLSAVGLSLCAVAAIVIFLFGSADAFGVFTIMAVGAFSAGIFLATGLICHLLNHLLLGPRRDLSFVERWFERSIRHYRTIAAGITALAIGVVGVILVAVFVRASDPAAQIAIAALGAVAVGGTSVAMAGVIARTIYAVGRKQKTLVRHSYQLADQLGSLERSTTNSVARRHWTENPSPISSRNPVARAR